MEDVSSTEKEDFADNINENVVDMAGSSEKQEVSEYLTSGFLTASEIYTMRGNICKNNSDDAELYKGPKLYHPSEMAASKEIVDDILQDNKKSLELQRIAKIRDCVKAEWNEELKVAAVPYLKGRGTQHMGVSMKGKCMLFPEEALFLLEKGSVEVEHNKMPLSVEEAYSVMLNGKLAVEKYEVYSYLSQQGFIVVRHQPRIGPRYEKIMNISKKKQRKRKATEPTENSKQKRLTFTGVLASNSGIDSVNTESSVEPSECLLNNKESSNNVQYLSQDILHSDQNMIVVPDSSEKVNPDTSDDCTISSDFATVIESNDAAEKEVSASCFQEHDKEDKNVKIGDVCLEEGENLTSANNKHASDKQEKADQDEVTVRSANDDNEIDVEKDNKEIDVENDNNKGIDVENFDDNEIDVENDKEIDVENDDDDTDEVIIEDEQKGDKSADINVEDSCSDIDNEDEYMSSDESIPVIYEESNDKSLDVYSCSPGDQPGEDSNLEEANSCDKRNEHDDEVTLVRVMKKEKKPLAVIDLLSDEEDNVSFVDRDRAGGSLEESGDNMDAENSDDEIQVLEEFPRSTNNTQSAPRSVNSIKLESRKLKVESSNVKTQYKPQMKFPDAFRKDIICVSRPPSNLLPLHVQPAKEAYVLSHKKSSQPKQGRLWNSFRDMQEYQRERRRERNMNSFNTRSGPFRDQNDSFSPHSYPLNPPEYSRDNGFDRNQNYPVAPSRSLYQPMNHHDRADSLLPTPSNFNSLSHIPLQMDIHNLQNLSSTNPVAFANEIHRTVYSVTSSLISNILGQQININVPPPTSSPAFSEPVGFSPHSHMNNFSMPSPMAYSSSGRSDFHPMRFPPDLAFSGERYPFPMNNSQFMPENNWRQPNHSRQRNFQPRGPSFPCRFRTVHRKRDWQDVKAAVEGTNHSDSGSDIEEVPINLNQFLWSNDIQPLVKPGTKLPVDEVLKALRITQMANLCDTKCCNDRYLPNTPTLEISFDVYLPNTTYRKSEPSVPKCRIIVVKSSDPIPKYSELVYLQRKWNDGASLEVAVVDHGDISFYSFNSITVQEMVPFDS